MNKEHKERIKGIADLTREQIGDSEESVKINFIVPLLEALGHNRLDFEYMYKDIYVRKGLPQFAKLIIETKSYDKDLTQHIQQLERYCHEERPLLGIIANGTEFRIYSYWWRYRASFREHLIFLINKKDLKDERTIQTIDNILSRESLKSGDARKYVDQREEEIKLAESEIRNIKEKVKDYEDKFRASIKGFEEKIDEIKTSISNVQQELTSIQIKEKGQIADIWSGLGLPEPDVPQRGTTTETRAAKSEYVAEGDKPKIRRPKDGNIDSVTLKVLEEGPKTFEPIFEAVVKQFPKRDKDVLRKTTKRRLGAYFRNTYGIEICKDKNGRYYIK